HRRQAAAADRRDALPLRLGPAPSLGVVERLHQFLVPEAHLERERPLPRLGEQLLRLEPFADLGAEAEPIETAGGENDRVETALVPLPQARVDIAPQRLDREVRLEPD